MGFNLQMVELFVEEPIQPWQVVKGQGQTWLIMRRKFKLAEQEIIELGHLVLESNSCRLVSTDKEKFLYQGNIGLKAYYRSGNKSPSKPVTKSVYDEEEARERLKSTVNCPLMSEEKKTSESVASIFSSRLYLEPTWEPGAEDMKEFSVWPIELSWQAWLLGGKVQDEPKIVAAHLSQIGLSTLLCEVLICLSAEDHSREAELSLENQKFIMNEEVALIIPERYLTDVVGSATQRAFYQAKPGPKASLELSYWTKIKLFFIGDKSGGERILTAWAVFANNLRVDYPAPLELQPFISDVRQEKITLVRAGEQKVILQAQVTLNLIEGVSRQEELPESSLEEKVSVEEQVDSLPNNIFARPRPGVKWQNKKKQKPRTDKSAQHKVLTIKFAVE